MSLTIRRLIGDPIFQSNCYILGCPEAKQGIVIDPGIRVGEIAQAVAAESLKISAIVNTHAHIDHVAGVHKAKEDLGAPFFLHAGDRQILENVNVSAARFGLPPVDKPSVDRWLEDGDKIELGERSLEVIHTPGHSPGGICLLVDGHLFSGDTLFAGSIGRTDFSGGDFETLIKSIRNRILTLPAETVIHPGHGPDTTVEMEKAYNPFLQ